MFSCLYVQFALYRKFNSHIGLEKMLTAFFPSVQGVNAPYEILKVFIYIISV